MLQQLRVYVKRMNAAAVEVIVRAMRASLMLSSVAVVGIFTQSFFFLALKPDSHHRHQRDERIQPRCMESASYRRVKALVGSYGPCSSKCLIACGQSQSETAAWVNEIREILSVGGL